jgi:hypothetical protein
MEYLFFSGTRLKRNADKPDSFLRLTKFLKDDAGETTKGTGVFVLQK